MLGGPCLIDGEPVHFFLNGGFEDHWKTAFKRSELLTAGWIVSSWVVDADIRGQAISKPLVIGPAQHIPRRRGQSKMLLQLSVSPRKQRSGFVAGWKQHPSVELVGICEPDKILDLL